MRLLIAEDERDLAEALSVFFEKNQFTVDTVYNGFDAYEYAVTGDYDAIVLDVMMPKLNGVEVLERLRAEGVRTPVMMLTAKAGKDDRITGFNAGADDYLPKPFAPDELICRVRAMLRRGGEYRPTVLAFGDAALDCSTGMLSCAGQSVRLSGREWSCFCARRRSYSRLSAFSSASGAGTATRRSTSSGCTSRTCARSSRASARA